MVWFWRRLSTPFRDQPLTAVATVVALVVGVGINALTYGVVRGLWLDAVPFQNASQLLVIRTLAPSGAEIAIPDHVADVLRTEPYFEAVAFVRTEVTQLALPTRVAYYAGLRATPSTFSVLKDTILLGRAIAPAGHHPEVVIGYRLWVREFGADPTVVGRSVTVNGRPTEVVGVAKPTFERVSKAALILSWPGGPTALDPATRVLVRLRRDGELTRVRSLVTSLTEVGAASDTTRLDVTALRDVVVSRDVRQTLRALALFSALLGLVSACAVASLQASRARRQAPATAIRLMLGAPRWRVVAGLVGDCAVYAVVGVTLGVAIAYIGLPVFGRHLPSTMDVTSLLTPDAVNLTAAGGLGIVAGVLAGLQPALGALRAASLRPSEGSATAFRKRWPAFVLVSVPICASTVLMIAMLALNQTFFDLSMRDLGMQSGHVIVATLGLEQGDHQYRPDQGQRATLLVETLGTYPAIRSAAAVDVVPFSGARAIRRARAHSASGAEAVDISVVRTTTGYFDTLGIPVVTGRVFHDRDEGSTEPVAVITESLARMFWSDRTAVGEWIWLSGQPPLRVIGVVGDVLDGGPLESSRPQMYQLWSQRKEGYLSVLVRLERGQAVDLRTVVDRWAATVGTPTPRLEVLSDGLDDLLALHRVRAMALVVLGVAAALMSMTILAALAIQAGLERRRELAIRVALGLSPRAAVMVLSGALLRPACLGVAVGAAIAVVGGGLLLAQIAALPVFDRTSLVGGATVMLLFSVVAAIVPVARYDPADDIRRLSGR